MNVKDKSIYINDNLSVMRGMDSEIVDLVYLDPPFNSNRNYAAPVGTGAYGAAFKDIWTLDDVKNEELGLLAEAHPELSEYIRSVGKIHSSGMMAYLIMMASRLIEIERIMKPTASVYLHVDPTASHYLKLIMDSIMGLENFRNEIIWCYSNIGNAPKANFPRKHDVILFYTKTKKSCYNQVFYEHWKSGEKAKPCDWWIDITSFNGFMKPKGDEHCGYPTQKPLKLLERIINASSNEGDVVFDPFCGCATTLVVADRLQRQWVGIDISPVAAKLVQERIEKEGGLVTGINVLETLPTLSSEGSKPTKQTKHELYGKQQGLCNGCENHFKYENFEIDHIIPKSKGGQNVESNLQLLCGYCNRVKGNRLNMAELRVAHKESGFIK